MDPFFPEKLLGEFFWDDSLLASHQSDSPHYEAPPATQSAFVQYRDLPTINSVNGSNSENMSKRMLAFLRKSFPAETKKVQENERERGFRHMINERMRRQRQRNCCLALHSMLPLGTKMDNNSVIEMAAKEILRLQGCRQELQSQKIEVESVDGNPSSKVQYLRVPHPKSGIDSMIETLKYLKDQGVHTTSIKSTFSPHELFAELEIQTHHKVAGGDRDGESTTLDRKLHSHSPEGSNKKQKTIHYLKR